MQPRVQSYPQDVSRWTELKQAVAAKNGMCMAVAMFRQPGLDALYVAVGYEDGTLTIWDAACPQHAIMSARLHSEPIMTFAIDAHGKGVLTATARSF